MITTHQLEWSEARDDDDNSIWEAVSPCHDGSREFRWRLKQRLVDNRIEWYAAHDEEQQADIGRTSWPSLEIAQREIQTASDRIIQRTC